MTSYKVIENSKRKEIEIFKRNAYFPCILTEWTLFEEYIKNESLFSFLNFNSNFVRTYQAQGGSECAVPMIVYSQ